MKWRIENFVWWFKGNLGLIYSFYALNPPLVTQEKKKRGASFVVNEIIPYKEVLEGKKFTKGK